MAALTGAVAWIGFGKPAKAAGLDMAAGTDYAAIYFSTGGMGECFPIGTFKWEPPYSVTYVAKDGTERTELFDHTTLRDAVRASQTKLNWRCEE